MAALVGASARKPGAVGAGLLAASRAPEFTPWQSVSRAVYHPRLHTVVLKNSWRVVAMLVCPPDLYEQVAAFVAARLEPQRASKNPLLGLLLAQQLSPLVLTSKRAGPGGKAPR